MDNLVMATEGWFDRNESMANPFAAQIKELGSNFSKKKDIEEQWKGGRINVANLSKYLSDRLDSLMSLASSLDFQHREAVKLLKNWRDTVYKENRGCLSLHKDYISLRNDKDFNAAKIHDMYYGEKLGVDLSSTKKNLRVFIPDIVAVDQKDAGYRDSHYIRLEVRTGNYDVNSTRRPSPTQIVEIAKSLESCMKEWGDLAHGKGLQSFESRCLFWLSPEEIYDRYWAGWVQHGGSDDLARTAIAYVMPSKKYINFRNDLVDIHDKTLEAVFKLLKKAAG